MWKRWLLPATLGLLAATALAWGLNQYGLRRGLETYLAGRYQRSFYELMAHVQNVEVLLAKALVASDQQAALLSDVWQQASAAQEALTQLPLGEDVAARTATFLTQVADYAQSFLRRGVPAEKEWDNLQNLYRQAGALNRELHDIEANYGDPRAYFTQLTRLGRQPEGPAMAVGFRNVDRTMQGYPTLVYDGPFSEHLERQEPRGLGKEKIDADGAVRRALAFLDPEPGASYSARTTGSVRAKISAWRVEVEPAPGAPGSRAVVDVSEQGGQVVWLLVLRPVGDPTIGVEQAREKAMQFLGARGYPPMEVTYHLQQGNTVTFNMAPVQNGVVLYPDLVKVTVALDNGKVVGLESTGYLFNHHVRDLPAPRVTRAAALAKLSPRLKASGGRLALVPTEGGGEKLTYEFLAKLGEDAFLIYVDALTGRQERILKLIPLPGGTLTM